MSTELIIAPASFKATKYACTHFHYSQTTPSGKLISFGIWENKKFKGVIIFSRGATHQIGDPYQLKQTQITELTRVALINHEHNVTKLLSKCLKELHKTNPGLELAVSYADVNQNHLGIIYQAGNWIYEGYHKVTPSIILNGEKIHARTVYSKYGHNGIQWLKKKHRQKRKICRRQRQIQILIPIN